MDFSILIIIAIVGFTGVFLFYAVKILAFLGLLLAQSISWHRWAIMVEAEGSFWKWWEQDRFGDKKKKSIYLVKSIFRMIPEIADCSEFSRGVSTWRGIGDWNARNYTPSRILAGEVVGGILFVIGIALVLFGFSAIARYFNA